MMDLKLIEMSGLGKKKQTGPENGDARWWLNWAVFSWTLLRQTGHWGLMKTVCALERKKKKNSWWAVKKMFALSRAAAEMLAVAACLQVGCLRSTGL